MEAPPLERCRESAKHVQQCQHSYYCLRASLGIQCVDASANSVLFPYFSLLHSSSALSLPLSPRPWSLSVLSELTDHAVPLKDVTQPFDDLIPVDVMKPSLPAHVLLSPHRLFRLEPSHEQISAGFLDTEWFIDVFDSVPTCVALSPPHTQEHLLHAYRPSAGRASNLSLPLPLKNR